MIKIRIKLSLPPLVLFTFVLTFAASLGEITCENSFFPPQVPQGWCIYHPDAVKEQPDDTLPSNSAQQSGLL